MADLVELVFTEDGTLVKRDTKQRVDPKPLKEPMDVIFTIDRYKNSSWEERVRMAIIREKPEIIPENANAYVIGNISNAGYRDIMRANVQFYTIYNPNRFRELYEGIVARIEQHPEVELRGQFVDHSPFADVNVDLYVVPYHMIRDASKLNEILHNLTPEGIEPTRRMDAFVQEEFHVLSFGVLGFNVEIGQKTTSKTYTGMMPEDLLKAIEEGDAIERGVYTAGIRLKIFPHGKFVFQNANGVWVPEKYSCGFYELDALETMDKKE